MCGRYTNVAEFSQIRLVFEAADATFRPFFPKYNISPSSGAGYEQLIVTADRSGTRQIRLARFWLIPSFWSRPLSELPTTFNARSEDLARRRIWQEPFARARCLVPATGWREFAGEAGAKQPYHFRPLAAASEAPEPFAFAGLRSTWTSPDGEVVDSFAILTTEPSPAAARIHRRMPLLLPPDARDAWLEEDDARENVLAASQAYTAALPLDIFPSDPIANSVHYEGPLAIQRLDPSAPRRRSARPKAAVQQLSLLDPSPSSRRRS